MVAAEIRAEMGRAGLTQTALAGLLHEQKTWLSRRIGANADIDLTLEEVMRMAEALGIAPQRLFRTLLPRLDSNQQPSGYPLSLVGGGLGCPGLPGVVIDLAAERARRVA